MYNKLAEVPDVARGTFFAYVIHRDTPGFPKKMLAH